MGSLSKPPARGTPRILVRLPGFRFRATVLHPQAHPRAVYLLPWVEALLQGRPFEEVVRDPPWPAPGDPLISRQLGQDLLDLGWVRPAWSSGDLAVAPRLRDAWAEFGRDGLARELHSADEELGSWWMDLVTGTVLSLARVSAFDWDRTSRADRVLEPVAEPEDLLDLSAPSLRELLVKLPPPPPDRETRERARIPGPLEIGERVDLLFPMWGPPERRLLPDELSDLEPGLQRAHPELFGGTQAGPSRVVRLPPRPVEAVVKAVEGLPSAPAEFPSQDSVQNQAASLHALVARRREKLETWLEAAHEVRPVAGPPSMHFAALEEICRSVPEGGVVTIASAFLNAQLAAADGGFARCLSALPGGARAVVVYGHADDLTLTRQHQDIDEYVRAMRQLGSTDHVTLLPALKRSHEKLVVTSGGDWMVGSWNPTSSDPSARLFECGLRGRDASFAGNLLERLLANVEPSPVAEQLAEVARQLEVDAGDTTAPSGERVQRLLQATSTLLGAASSPDASAWAPALAAVRAAVQPLRRAAHLRLVDEQQTREVVVQHLAEARTDVLLASDRVTEEGLDIATLRDLGRERRLVRVLWGREWAGAEPRSPTARKQLARARRAIRQAGDELGDLLLSDTAPMETHAKAVVVDGLHGLVTSENLLGYGGEKGQYESRELGVSFDSPVLARALLGAMILWQPGVLERSARGRGGPAWAWLAAANEAWHALEPLAADLDDGWATPDFLAAVIADEATRLRALDGGDRAEAWATLAAERGPGVADSLWRAGQRLGLVQVGSSEWTPWDCRREADTSALIDAAAAAVDRLPTASVTVAPDPVISQVEELLVRIEAGSFRMGDDRVRDERPAHQVTISRPFLLARVPVTQQLWGAVMGRVPRLQSNQQGPDLPVVQVSRRDIEEFLRRLNDMPGGGGFGLPTEAQWEYACRAGSTTVYCFGDDPGAGKRPGLLEQYAWTKRNAGQRSHPVGELRPNAWGLYDMHGLVYEAVRDRRRGYDARPVVDPVGLLGDTGPDWVARGGAWGRFPLGRGGHNEHFRSASRQVFEPSHRVGFRLMRELGE